MKKKALGRGLDALLPNIGEKIENTIEKKTESIETQTRNNIENEILFIDIHKITPNLKQPRKLFNEEKLEELAESIEMHGLIQPIVVNSIDSGYEIIAGERRWRASKKAGIKEVPCIIKKISEKQHMLLALIENLQREDLNPVEEARAYEFMRENYAMTQEEVAVNVGKSRPFVTNTLRLLKLMPEVQEMILTNKISNGHGRALINIDNSDLQLKIAKEIIKKGLSVRQVEKLVKELKEEKKPIKTVKKEIDIELESVVEDIMRKLGTKVNIKDNNNKGKVEIEYYSREELERIIEVLTTD